MHEYMILYRNTATGDCGRYVCPAPNIDIGLDTAHRFLKHAYPPDSATHVTYEIRSIKREN
jgi:hypothetical protein